MQRKRIALLSLAAIVGCFISFTSARAEVCTPEYWCWKSPTPFGWDINVMWTTGTSDVFAVGESGSIAHFDGSSWSLQQSGIADTLNGIWGSANNDIFAVGDSGKIIRFNGSSWSPMASPTGQNLRAVWGADSTHVYATGDNGTILSYDGISGWISMTSGVSNTLRGIWGAEGRHLPWATVGQFFPTMEATGRK